MNPQAAGELVHLWLQAHEDPATVSAQRGPVSRAVRALVPDAEHTAVGRTPAGPAMVVLVEPALIVLDAAPFTGDGARPGVRARLVRLDPEHSELEVVERFEERPGPDGDPRTVRMRRWQLRADGIVLQIEGAEVVQGGTQAELGHPDAGEALGRVIAARVGWRLP